MVEYKTYDEIRFLGSVNGHWGFDGKKYPTYGEAMNAVDEYNSTPPVENEWGHEVDYYDEYGNCYLKPIHITSDPVATPFEDNSGVWTEYRSDAVNSPSHYGSGTIECIEYIEDFLSTEEYTGYLRGNIAKYLHRWRYKNQEEDLRKAQWYLNRLIELQQKTPKE